MTHPLRSAAVLCLFLLLPCLAGCQLFRAEKPEVWEESELAVMNQQVLFTGAVYALQKEGFPVGMGADAGKGMIETGWRVQQSPFKGKGFRERAYLEFAPSGDGLHSTIRVRVLRETNESLRPLVQGSAKWERADDPVDVSRRVLQYAHSYLDPGSVIGDTTKQQP